MPQLSAMAKRSREKVLKKQHIHGAENILLEDCSQKVFKTTIRNREAGLTASSHGVLDVPGPTSGEAVLRSKLVGLNSQSRLSTKLFGVSHDFLRNSRNCGLESLRKTYISITLQESIPPVVLGPKCYNQT